MNKRILLSVLISTAAFGAVASASAQACTLPFNWWSQDELFGNDYKLQFKIPAWSPTFKIVGGSNQIQAVINKAISQGGVHQSVSGGWRTITFTTGARARWGNGYFGSLNDYRQRVLVYWP